MKHHRRHYRRPAFRRIFLLDSLESRCLLATGLPGVSEVTFDTLTTPPQVEITFDQNDVSQIDGMLAPVTGMTGLANFSVLLNVLDSASDFEIDQVGMNATFVSQFVGPDNPPAVVNVSNVTVAGVPEVQVAIPISGPAPEPGHYQVCIEGSTTLDLLFDAIEPGTAWDTLSSSFQPQAIGQFTVIGQGRQLPERNPPSGAWLGDHHGYGLPQPGRLSHGG